MSSGRYECSENSKTDIGKCEKELLARGNHFNVIHDILKGEIIKEELAEVKWCIETGVCNESHQEVGQSRISNESVPSNLEENPRQSKHSLNDFWKNTNFDTKGSECIFAADQEVDQIKNEIKVENDDEDFSEGPDDFSTTNAELKGQTLKTEDEIDIIYEDIESEIHGDKLSGNNCCPKTIANIVPHKSSIDFGAVLQQNSTVEENETDVERDNQKKIQCDLCFKSFTRKFVLKIHKRTHTGEKPYQCNFCSKSFSNSGNLKIHERIHTGEKPFQCNFCSKSFAESKRLKIHERIHTGEKPYKCNFCSKSYTASSSLKCHEKTHTGEKRFHCNICSKSFTQNYTLKSHERIHTGEKPFQCNFCPELYSYRRTLKIHERIHTGEQPFQCNFCSKSFTVNNSLKIHEKSHTGERFRCNLCPKTFSRSCDLKIHKRIHTGLKPCQCNFCPESYSDSRKLKIHERIHTGKKPFQCNLCPKSFSRSSVLKTHERIHIKPLLI